MSIEQLAVHFLRLEVFQGLPPLSITEVARRAERVVYRPGQILMEDGQQGDAAVLVVSGEAVVMSSSTDDDTKEPIPEGSLLGEMAMLVETEHSSTIVARSPVRALRIPRTTMLEIMADDPAVAEHFVQKVVGRLQRVAEQLREVDAILAGISPSPAEEPGKTGHDQPRPNTSAIASAPANREPLVTAATPN